MTQSKKVDGVWKSYGCLVSIAIFIAITGCANPQQVATEPASSANKALNPDENQNEKFVVHKTESTNGRVTLGYFEVPENRTTGQGRKLKLQITLLHSRADQPEPDPVFVLAGGPGVDANQMRFAFENSWMRKHRDVVLVSQRGTAGNHRLAFPQSALAPTHQQLMEPFPLPEQVHQARIVLSQTADLTQYSTCAAMDDLNDIRKALGYERINLVGSSYGTRAALVYIRQHGKTVRSAILEGVAPLEFINPLYHASEAQRALDLIFAEVESTAEYRQAFPELRKQWSELLQRFDQGPIVVVFQGQLLELSRDSFTASLRSLMYSLNTSRQIPFLISQAARGNFDPFLANAINRNRDLRDAIAMGMLLCVTAAEDIDRINPAEIAAVTQNTFLGDSRIRQQQAACDQWPRSELPEGFGEPVSSEVPVLILSGTIDPVISPRFGEMIKQHFTHSEHVIVPGAHGVSGECIESIRQQFLDEASVANLKLDCIKQLELPPLRLR